MVLYELICIAPKQVSAVNIREIARTAGATIINNGGVVRGIRDWGIKTLPKPIKKYQGTHNEARYFLMWFDSNPRIQKDVSLTIKLDPRVLRHSVVKLGDKLEDLHTIEKPML